MSFTAKFNSECGHCGNTIRRGDEAEFNGSGDVVHVLCPMESDLTRPAAGVCSRCFTELPVTGVCGVCE